MRTSPVAIALEAKEVRLLAKPWKSRLFQPSGLPIGYREAKALLRSMIQWAHDREDRREAVHEVIEYGFQLPWRDLLFSLARESFYPEDLDLILAERRK